jgi:6-phosphogluconolactonase
VTTKVVPGQLVAVPGAEDVAKEAATRMAKALRAALRSGGRAAIALSGGNTPRAAYGLLAKEPHLDWSKTDVFWVDERAVKPTDDRSNYRWAKQCLLDPARIPPERIHRMPADIKDLDAAAREYEKLLRTQVRAGTDGVPIFDMMVLGVGDDGHTASLFPEEPTIAVHDRLVASVAAKGKREARLTLTATVIEHANQVFVLATGAEKSGPLERVWAVEGNLTKTPARVIRGARGGVTWIIDRAAGGLAGSTAAPG